jgi:hypothetical protein
MNPTASAATAWCCVRFDALHAAGSLTGSPGVAQAAALETVVLIQPIRRRRSQLVPAELVHGRQQAPWTVGEILSVRRASAREHDGGKIVDTEVPLKEADAATP